MAMGDQLMNAKLNRRYGKAAVVVGLAALAAVGGTVAFAATAAQARSAATVPSAPATGRPGFPPAQPIVAGKAWMSVDSALSTARGHAAGPTGNLRLAPAAAAALPAKAKQMTMAQFDALEGLGADPAIAGDRPVLVVTVHGAMSTDARPGAKATAHNVYTEVYDAPTGTLILQGIGIDALK
jgi:hypothetical protein